MESIIHSSFSHLKSRLNWVINAVYKSIFKFNVKKIFNAEWFLCAAPNWWTESRWVFRANYKNNIEHLELVTQSLKVPTHRMHRPQVFSAQIDCWCQVDMQIELGAINALQCEIENSDLFLYMLIHAVLKYCTYIFMNWINLRLLRN